MRMGLSRVVALVGILMAGSVQGAPEASSLYGTHCAACHGEGRLGAMGPALLPESLARISKAEIRETILSGREATQMPAFQKLLSDEQISALMKWIQTPVSPPPRWEEADIRGSRIQHVDPGRLSDQPVFHVADMLNLFVVVEAGDHHVSILDGDKLERIHRFPSRFALHGGPKFTPEGRYVYFASRDGWVTKFDIWNLKVVSEIRAGLNTRNLAVSSDGKVVAVANYLPHSIVLLDGDLNFLKTLPVLDQDGTQSSRVSAIYDAAPRHSFIAALKDVPEVWEISYDPRAEDIPNGMIHDFRYREGAFIPGYLNPRRTKLAEILDDFFFTQDYSEVMGASRVAGKGQVVNLDARRAVAALDLPGMPHLGSGITWQRQGQSLMATPNLKEGAVSVLDMKDWSLVRQIPTKGPGFFLRSHESSRYAWVDSMMSPAAKDTLQVIDKETLEVVKELRPEPGKTLAHVEFTRDGRYVLASLMEKDGAIIIFDANSLKEIKRLPASKPVGKYNIFNKISKSEGTSH